MAAPGDQMALLRPGEAAAAIGVKPSTLRVYVQRFGALLSDDATAGERPGYRFYTARDVELLKRARELLVRGFTYERAIAELRPGTAQATERQAGARRRRGGADGAGVEALERAVEAWRALAEERAAEIASLREEVRRLQELLIGARRTPVPIAARHRQRA
jgi:DNA-binding transcriptional MerR regulator